MDGPRELSPLEDALAFIDEQDSTYTEEALRASLVDSGYPNAVIDEAMRIHDEAAEQEGADPSAASGPDLRGRAAVYLIVATLAAWGACAAILALTNLDEDYSYDGIGLMILALVLGLVLLVALMVVGISGSLKRGRSESILAILIAPVVIIFGLAGTCVLVMRDFGG